MPVFNDETAALRPLIRARVIKAFIPYLVFAVAHLVMLAVGFGQAAAVSKWVLMPLLLAALLLSLPRRRTALALLASLGILFSWFGDVLLGVPGDFGFLIGLCCFLLAHVAYLTLFVRRLSLRRVPWLALVYLAWWIVFVALLAQHLGSLLVPVALYGAVLGSMAAFALRCNRWVAIGGALFVVSDSLLGLHRFLPGFDFWQIDFVIMLSYLLAEGLIAWGVVHTALASSARDSDQRTVDAGTVTA